MSERFNIDEAADYLTQLRRIEESEIARLRGIEKAVTPQGLGFTRENTAEFWRLVAGDPCYWRGAVKVHGNMIADALDC